MCVNSVYISLHTYTYVHIKGHVILVFLLNQVRTLFLEIAYVCHVCICVCPPQGYKLHSLDIEPVQPAEQVCCVYKRN